MDSQNDEIEQSTTELKYLGFVKEIAVKFLVLLSTVYDFTKENSGVLKTAIDSAENAVVSTVGPVYEDIKDVPEQILVVVDGKFDKYAPALVKNLTTKLHSLIKKTIPIVQRLLTTASSLVAPFIRASLSLLQKALNAALSLLHKLITAIQSIPLISKAQSLLQKHITTATSSIQSPLKAINTATSSIQSLLPKDINTATSSIQSLLQSGPDVVNQLLDTTKAAVGDVPVVGKAAQSFITNSTDFANQLVNTTNNLVKENPVLNTVNTAAQNILKEAQDAGMKVALQSAYTSLKLMALPAIAEFWYKANTYPLFNTVAEVVLPVAECVSEWYNKVVTYMDGKGYSLFGYLPLVPIDEMKAAYKVVKMAMDGLSAVGGMVGTDN